MKRIALLLVAGLAAFNLNAQTFTEGRVVTKITYPDFDGNPGILAMLPKEIVSYHKGNKTVVEQDGAMGTKTIIIIDDKKKETNTYMDLMGQKFQLVSKEADVKKENQRDLEADVTITKETKTIAGYTCKKADVKYKDGEEGEIWFCPDLAKGDGAEWNQKYKGVNGMMMEFSVTKQSTMGPMTMKMTVTEIAKEKIADSKFEAPAGEWKKTTTEDMMKSLGGGK